MVRRASLAHHWLKRENHPEQVSPKGESFDAANEVGLTQDMVSEVEPRVEGSFSTMNK